MNYSLVKQLRDAGFPKYWKGFDMHDPAVLEKDWMLMYEYCYSPSLTELIQACGDKFHQLGYFSSENLWGASAQNNTGLDLFGHQTPEEAVSKLWLELNKKS